MLVITYASSAERRSAGQVKALQKELEMLRQERRDADKRESKLQEKLRGSEKLTRHLQAQLHRATVCLFAHYYCFVLFAVALIIVIGVCMSRRSSAHG